MRVGAATGSTSAGRPAPLLRGPTNPKAPREQPVVRAPTEAKTFDHRSIMESA